MYKILLFLFFIPSLFAQSDTNCVEPFGCMWVSKMVEIVGGLDSLNQKVIYPSEALKHKIEGKVYVEVFIDTLGHPDCIKVIKSLGFGCDEEAIRLVKNAKYVPAYVRNKKVKVPVVIPVTFKLPGK